MQAKTGRMRGWLIPTMLILFILEIMMLPVVIGVTYGGPSEGPKHVLSYQTGILMWDSATGIREDGTAELSLFSDGYEGVKSEDGVKIIAPGTGGKTIVRLKNDISGSITYTAVLYDIKSTEALNVISTLGGDNLTDTERYFLPEGMEDVNVIRAVTGTLPGKEFQDFSVEWIWPLSGDSAVDTALGDKAAFSKADDITVGLYIVVEDENAEPDNPNNPDKPKPDNPIIPDNPHNPDDPSNPIDTDYPSESNDPDIIESDDSDYPYDSEDSAHVIWPEVPETGDKSIISTYLVLLAISGAVLLFLLIGDIDKRRDKA